MKKSGLSFLLLLLILSGCDPQIGNPTFSPDGKSILFSINSKIYKIPVGGGKAQQIHRSDSYDFDPVYTPDGSKIVFASRKEGSKADIFVMNADGSGRRQLTQGSSDDRKPAVSSDGSTVYFHRIYGSNWSSALCSIKLDGADLKEIIKAEENTGFTISPHPDGDEILFSGVNSGGDDTHRNALRILSLKNPSEFRKVKPIFKTEPKDKWMTGITEARFSPDGKFVVFLWYMYNERKEHNQIYIMDLESRKARKIAEFSDDTDYVSFSPDGRKIIVSTGTFNYILTKLWTMNIDGSDLRRVPIKS